MKKRPQRYAPKLDLQESGEFFKNYGYPSYQYFYKKFIYLTFNLLYY